MVNTNYNSAISAYNQAAKIGTNKSAGENIDGVRIGAASVALGGAATTTGNQQTNQSSFPAMLEASLDKATNAAFKGEEMTIKSLVDKAELHEMVTAVTNAELTLETVVAVRDKIITAYQDILKMPI